MYRSIFPLWNTAGVVLLTKVIIWSQARIRERNPFYKAEVVDFFKTHVFWIWWPDHTQACNSRIDSLHFLCLLALEIAWKKNYLLLANTLLFNQPSWECWCPPHHISISQLPWVYPLCGEMPWCTGVCTNTNSMHHQQHHSFHCFFPSSRKPSPSWAAAKCNTYLQKNSVFPGTKYQTLFENKDI